MKYSFMTKTNVRHARIIITGRVQGVGYRFAARTMAQSLGLKGFVKNQTDGSVYVEAEGIEYRLDQFVQWCHKGPTYANVENVSVESGDVKGYRYFDIAS